MFLRYKFYFQNPALSDLIRHFILKGSRKCFNIEQPKDTPIIFSYEIIDDDHTIEFELFYGIAPKSELQIIHETLTEKVGHIDFTVDNDGYYLACFQQAAKDKFYPTVIYSSL